INKRDDGYHNLESIFYPIPLCDILEVNLTGGKNDMNLTLSGIKLPDSDSDNILFKCYELMQEYAELPSISCHLHKQIPIGAGLGGGSSDAAFFLKYLNDHANLPNLTLEKILNEVGSDCVFFLKNKPAFVSQTGAELEEISFGIEG